eukprot:gene1562-1902_t
MVTSGLMSALPCYGLRPVAVICNDLLDYSGYHPSEDDLASGEVLYYFTETQARAERLLLAPAPSKADGYFDDFVPSSSAPSEAMDADEDSVAGDSTAGAAGSCAASGSEADDEGGELDDEDDDDDEDAAAAGGRQAPGARKVRRVHLHTWGTRPWRAQHAK